MLAGSLVKLINNSIKKGIIPQELKKAVIRPIYKSGSHYNYSNYRPISILSSVNKIIERYVANNLNKYMKENKIINECQYAYQMGKGTNELLADFSDFINNELSSGKQVLVIFIDFSKAFDTLKHDKISVALEEVGIRGPLNAWFMEYIRDRKIVVNIDEAYSKPKVLKYGVPQGSILGPLIYLLYVNSMPSIIKNSKVYMYADDTVLAVSGKNIELAEKKIQEDFLQLTKWCHDNGLTINGKKSKAMHIHSPYFSCREPNIKAHSYDCLHLEAYLDGKCSCTLLENVINFKYLGITMDHNLKWDMHIREITKRLRVCAVKFYYLRQFLPFHTMKLLYSSMCESLIRYGLRSWGNASHTTIVQIQTAQAGLLRMIGKLDSTVVEANPSICFQFADTLPVEKLFKYLLIVDYYFSNKFKVKNSHGYNARRVYVVPRTNNKYSKRTNGYLVPVLFNELPVMLTEFKSYIVLKRELKKYFINS